MKNLDLLNLLEKDRVLLNSRIDKYYGYCGILIEILEFKNKNLKIKVTQKKVDNGFILTKNQLVSRGKGFFEGETFYNKINVIPLTYRIDFSVVDSKWITEKMLELNLKASDLVNQLGINKSTLSQILNGNTKVSKPFKACFYYYFMVFELNKEFREIN